jgi:hypothetical protein
VSVCVWFVGRSRRQRDSTPAKATSRAPQAHPVADADIDDLILSDDDGNHDDDDDDDLLLQLAAGNLDQLSQPTALDAEAQLLQAMALNRKLKRLESKLDAKVGSAPTSALQKLPSAARPPQPVQRSAQPPVSARRVSNQGAVAIPRQPQHAQPKTLSRTNSYSRSENDLRDARQESDSPSRASVKSKTGAAAVVDPRAPKIPKDASHSREEVLAIQRDNMLLLKHLEDIHKKGGAISFLPQKSEVKHVAPSMVNRKKSQKAVVSQNMACCALRGWICLS